MNATYSVDEFTFHGNPDFNPGRCFSIRTICRKRSIRHCREKFMAIIIRLDRVLADRKMQMNDLADKVASRTSTCPIWKRASEGNSILHTGSYLQVLNCQPAIFWNISRMAEYSRYIMGLEVGTGRTETWRNEGRWGPAPASIWFIGWLFTIGFANLILVEIILGIVVGVVPGQYLAWCRI